MNRKGSKAVSIACLLLGSLSLAASSLSASGFQAAERPNATRARRIQVTAEEIGRLPKRASYVVDLTTAGVVYEFDSTTRAIDFTRIVARTSAGDKNFERWLREAFPRTKLDGWNSGRLRVAVRAQRLLITAGRQSGRRIAPGPLPFECNSTFCVCRGDADCNDMFGTDVCGPIAICINDVCVCGR